MLKLATLGNVLGDIHREMQRVWRTNLQLPDNLPVLVEYRAAHLPEADRVKIENTVGLGKTGLLDTHPSAAERIARARTAADPGLEISDAPARGLFDHFDAVSRLVTLAHYEDDLNVPTSPDFLIPLEQLIRARSEPDSATPPAPAPMPMMGYDPARFQRPEPPAN